MQHIILVLIYVLVVSNIGNCNPNIEDFLTADEGPEHDSVKGTDYKLGTKFAEEQPNPIKYTCEQEGYMHPDFYLDIKGIIRKYGYDFEPHEVHTEDKYIITIFRIKASAVSPAREGKKAVFLHHGISGNAMSWIFLYHNNSLAFKLANAGYDVYLGNSRGSKVSQGHETLSPKSDKYWDFSFHEIAVYDLPAVTDYILKITGQPDMYYIGHSMGTAIYLVWQSERPEYAKKIRVGFLLSPAGYLHHLTSPGLGFLFGLYPPNHAAWKLTFGNFITKANLVKATDKACNLLALLCGFCDNAAFYIFGFNPLQSNASIANLFQKKYFDTAATKIYAHFGQVFQYKTFRPYDYKNKEENIKRYGVDPPYDYKINRIQAPTVAFWGFGDTVTAPIDVKNTLISFSQGVVKENNRVKIKSFDHLDFLIGKDVQKQVYNRILYIMDQGLYVTKKN